MPSAKGTFTTNGSSKPNSTYSASWLNKYEDLSYKGGSQNQPS